MDGTTYFTGSAWGPAPCTEAITTTQQGRLHGATKCSMCRTKRTADNAVKLDPDSGKPVCDRCFHAPAPDPEHTLGHLEEIRSLAVEAGYDDAELQHRDCGTCDGASGEGLCPSCGEPWGTGDETVVVAIREHRAEPWGYDEIELGCGDINTAIEDARYSLRRRIADREVAL